MKQLKIEINRLITILCCLFGFAATISARNDGDSLLLPTYRVNDKVFVFHSTKEKNFIERGLSNYIERRLPIGLYDMFSLRLLIYLKINKHGEVAKVKVVDKKYLKILEKQWEDIKRIIYTLRFKPAQIGNKPVGYIARCYIRIDLTRNPFEEE